MWAAGGKGAVLHVRPQRRAEHLVDAERRSGQRLRAKAITDVQGRPRAVAVDHQGRPDDRVRARLRHLDRRHRQRAGARGRRSRCAARRRRPASSTAPSPINCRSWRCRPTARRSPSPCTARSSRRRRRTAATPCASTQTAGEEGEIAWAPDSRQLAYMSDRDGTNHLFVYDFGTGKETQLTNGPGRDDVPRYSPDGKWIAFERNSKELRIDRSGDEGGEAAGDRRVRCAAVRRLARLHLVARLAVRRLPHRPAPRTSRTCTSSRLAGGEARAGQLPGELERRLAVVEPGRHLPDVRHLAAHRAGRRDAHRSAAAHAEVPRGSVPRSVPEEQPKTPATPPAPTAPCRPHLPRRAHRARPRGRAARRDRLRRHPAPRERAAGRRRRRARRRSAPTASGCCSPRSAAGQQNLYVFPIDELSKEPAVARQLTSTPAAKRSAHFTADSKEVYYLDRGRLFNVTLEKREPQRDCVSRRARRRLLAREDRSVPPGMDLPARPVLRREDERRRLERGAGRLRAAHRRRADARRDAAHHFADARRAERVAHGDLGAGARAQTARSDGWRSISIAPNTTSAGRLKRHRRSCRSGPAALAGIEAGRLPPAGRRPARSDARVESRRAARSHHRQADRAVGRPSTGRRAARRDRQAGQPDDREGAALPAMGRAAARVCRRRRAAAGSATFTCSTCRRTRCRSCYVDLDADNQSRTGRRRRRAQQQRRLRQRLRDRRAGAARLLQHADARLPVGVGAAAARPARAGAADDSRHQPALAVGRRRLHRRAIAR